jgi:hypothetical protein
MRPRGLGRCEHEEGNMTEITFHNKAEIRVQAQIFIGRALVSTYVANPGEVCSLSATSARYDIYLKNGATGWGIAHKLDSEAKTLTLSQLKGRYVII